MCLTSESPLAAPCVTARQEGGGQAREPLGKGAVVTGHVERCRGKGVTGQGARASGIAERSAGSRGGVGITEHRMQYSKPKNWWDLSLELK